jgi:hypothetical protein
VQKARGVTGVPRRLVGLVEDAVDGDAGASAGDR